MVKSSIENNNQCVLFLENNPFGFRLNVNHPQVNNLYRRYKSWKGLPLQFPVTDKERFEFEDFVLPKFLPKPV